MLKIFLFLSFLLSFSAFAKSNFFSGLSYMQISDYRVDNEINPLPLGSNIIPILGYRGKHLQVLGPNIIYTFLNGPISLGLRVNATGDRYKARNLKQRNTAINGGVSVRLLFLIMNYGVDLFNVYKGNTYDIGLGWRFKLSEDFFFLPKVSKNFLNSGYVNYYYGISTGEADSFSPYQAQSAINDEYSVGGIYKFSERSSFVLNYAHTIFDQVIANSPTVSERSFDRWSFFWSYSLN